MALARMLSGPKFDGEVARHLRERCLRHCVRTDAIRFPVGRGEHLRARSRKRFGDGELNPGGSACYQRGFAGQSKERRQIHEQVPS